ncbi:hypothetical protein [Actinomadura sp. B10D3]|uniref:hypothetical protein n=1 Tax=Actinomadura sp. B10D3 TaxID=3153557 RepID=UPI00325E3EF6
MSIDDETVIVLREHHRAQAADKLLVGEKWRGGDDGYVFATGWGDPIHPDTVGWCRLADDQAHPGLQRPKKGPRPAEPLPHARVHDLRHIHAMPLLLAGMFPSTSSRRVGRADLAITLRVYAHVNRSAKVAAADVFAQVMRGQRRRCC